MSVAHPEQELIPGALYLRESKDASGEELAVARQEQDGRALAARRGVRIVAVLTDNDTSASGSEYREDFETLLELIAARTIRAVISRDLDRLTRNRRDTVRLIELGMDAELIVMLTEGGDLDMGTTNGRLFADLRASIARHEIEEKGSRQKRANLQAAQQGRFTTGRRPFGYEKDGVTLRATEAAAVEEGYQILLSGGSLAEIARRWNAAGFTSGQAGWKGGRKGVPSPWRHDSVRAVLANPRYAGLRAYNGEIIGRAVWPAIVAEETWIAAQAILRRPARRTGYRGGPALLTGIALCGVCDAGVRRGGTARGYPVYRCGATLGHFSHKAVPVERYISALVIKWFRQPDVLERIASTEPVDRAALLADRTKLETRIAQAAAEFADDPDVTPAELRVITRRLRAQIAEIDAQLARVARLSALLPLVGAKNLRAVWDGDLTMSQKRTVVAALMTPRLLPPGRGTRVFRASTVEPGWRL